MVNHLKPKSVAYDLGANYGVHTLLMARCVSDGGHVYAFEPAPAICAELRRNVNLNGFPNVSIFELAVAAEPAQRGFVSGAHGGGGHLISTTSSQRGAQIVDTVSLDHFVYSQRNRPPTFMKIDVEGAESQVLTGARRVLKEARPTVLVELHSPSEDVAVGQILLDHGYSAYRIGKGGAMTKIANLTEGWPSPVGMWGQIIAFPST
jgi:FkbM family methyltransferase